MIATLTLPGGIIATLEDNLRWSCSFPYVEQYLNLHHNPLEQGLSPADGVPGMRQAREAADDPRIKATVEFHIPPQGPEIPGRTY